MNIANRIRTLRQEKKMSQEDFAKIIGISRANLSQIEVGNQLPTLKTLSEIVKNFNITYDYLIEGTKIHQKSNIKKYPQSNSTLTQVNDNPEDSVKPNINNNEVPPDCVSCREKERIIEALQATIKTQNTFIEQLQGIINKLTDFSEQKRKS